MRYGKPAVGRTMARVALAIALLTPAGCGYSFRAPFDRSVKTVYVPVFRSVSFRRDKQLQLTELVIKEIERRSGYKVVPTQEGADTILDGSINYADKNIVVENPFNMPRQLTAMVSCSVNWTHNPPTNDDLQRGPTTITENFNFVPEIGESAETAFYRANQAIAEQIVNMMEIAW